VPITRSAAPSPGITSGGRCRTPAMRGMITSAAFRLSEVERDRLVYNALGFAAGALIAIAVEGS
jgi:hypothetical protein